MELNELFDLGQQALEAEEQALEAEEAREKQSLADAQAKAEAKSAEYLAAIVATMQTALPECLWPYIDISQVDTSNSSRFPEYVYLAAPECAPIAVRAYLECENGTWRPGGVQETPMVIPCVLSEMPYYQEDGRVIYSYRTHSGAIEAKSLSYALALAKRRKAEFDAEESRYAAEIARMQKQNEAREAAKKAKAAQQPALAAEDRLRQALADLVIEVLDSALATKEM